MRAPQKYEYSKEITCENPVGIQGIMPTILAGIDIPETFTGKSLLPIMQGYADRIRGFLHGEHTGCCAYNHGPLRYRRVLQVYMVFPNR